MKKIMFWSIVLCVGIFCASSCNRHKKKRRQSIEQTSQARSTSEERPTTANDRDGLSLSLTNITSGCSEEDALLEHTGFVVSYNTEFGTPSWVAWELTSEETNGPVSRDDYSFIPDPLLFEDYQILPNDYSHSGYDRGHMCPAADMEWSSSAMNDCHYMTNICPQTPKLNQVYWERLESACRRWASHEGSIYIVCGPIYYSSATVIGNYHDIVVPEAFFKVVVCLRSGREKGIGFYYQNSDERQTMEGAATTIDEIEEITGFDFFSELPDELEEDIESQCNLRKWN